jgi:hypothetical protein
VAVRRLVRLVNVPITATPEILNILICRLRRTPLPRPWVNKRKRTRIHERPRDVYFVTMRTPILKEDRER